MGGLGCLGSMINVSDNLLCMIVAKLSHIVSHAGLHTRPTDRPPETVQANEENVGCCYICSASIYVSYVRI